MWTFYCARCGEFATKWIKADERGYCERHAQEREEELRKYRQLTRTLK